MCDVTEKSETFAWSSVGLWLIVLEIIHRVYWPKGFQVNIRNVTVRCKEDTLY